jgi:hypothetical protein
MSSKRELESGFLQVKVHFPGRIVGHSEVIESNICLGSCQIADAVIEGR